MLAPWYEVFHTIRPPDMDTDTHVQAKTLATQRDRAGLSLQQRTNKQLDAKQRSPTLPSTTCLKARTLPSKPSFTTPTSGLPNGR